MLAEIAAGLVYRPRDGRASHPELHALARHDEAPVGYIQSRHVPRRPAERAGRATHDALVRTSQRRASARSVDTDHAALYAPKRPGRLNSATPEPPQAGCVRSHRRWQPTTERATRSFSVGTGLGRQPKMEMGAWRPHRTRERPQPLTLWMTVSQPPYVLGESNADDAGRERRYALGAGRRAGACRLSHRKSRVKGETTHERTSRSERRRSREGRPGGG